LKKLTEIQHIKDTDMKLIESLEWRYATKKFDPEKKVNTADIEKLKEAIQLSASSYGLQPYTILEITDPVVREKLKPVSWGQTQITDASHLFVFCSYKKVGHDEVGQFMKHKAAMMNTEYSNFQKYTDFISRKLSEKSGQEIENWAGKQLYIALGNAMAAAGELHLDTCPIEGFEPEQYDKILGLSAKGLNANVVLAVGYRSDEDQTQHAPKVRRPEAELFETI
jgi:nitroreductase